MHTGTTLTSYLPNLGNSGTLIPTDLLSRLSSTLLCTTTLLRLLLVVAIGNYTSLLSACLYCVERPANAIKWGPKRINLHIHLHRYDVYASPPPIQPTFIHQWDTSEVILFPGHNLQSHHHTLEGEAKLASIIVNDWSTSLSATEHHRILLRLTWHGRWNHRFSLDLCEGGYLGWWIGGRNSGLAVKQDVIESFSQVWHTT